ncbi:MFS transporter [Nonomuraea typhae]|uniref:MFS transporter n=1 Tax=Nonomuraea typhae TaxID=2603600 RepID=UPI0012F9DC9D|nr:MFS transporter [Nonomuraea typhae]
MTATPAQPPAVPAVDEAAGMRRLFRTIPYASAAAPLAYAAAAYFLPLQIQAIDDSAKVENLGFVQALSAVAAMIAQPLVGVLSDRTRTRYGARTPWMLVGAVVGATAMCAAALSATIGGLVIAFMVLQFGFNAYQGPLSSILPDRVPVERRGRFSALIGLGTILAALLGPLLASAFASRIPVGYIAIGGVILLVIVAFVVLNPGADNRRAARPAFSALTFAKAFWVNPVRHPDFFWAFLGRLLLFASFAMTNSFNLYIAQDYIGLTREEAAHIVPLTGLAGLPGFLASTVIAGSLSDRLGRRKPIVLTGGLVIVCSAIIPFFLPSVAGLTISVILLTVGFGAFMAVDGALISEVLPDKDSYGKDLGVINIAATLPNIIAPVASGTIVTTFGGYDALYVAVTLVAAGGALSVLPIKSVS